VYHNVLPLQHFRRTRHKAGTTPRPGFHYNTIPASLAIDSSSPEIPTQSSNNSPTLQLAELELSELGTELSRNSELN
jgi:hypothetical protein